LEIFLGRKGFDSVTPYKHCLVYHVLFFTKKYGKLLRFSGQGVEKINDDIKKNHHSKTNKWDATVDTLQVRKMIMHLTSENCERDKRNYTKSTNEYWSDIILKQRAAKKTNISEEKSLVVDKLSENDPIPCSSHDLSVIDIRDELKKIGVKTRLKNRKTFRPFKE
jgi:tRNA/tmRNA/rRNA uracil-C5-methylase (TrmA/RlmC/RlmD family)